MPSNLPQKVERQIAKAGLPANGAIPFVPSLVRNRDGEEILEKAAVTYGPKKGKRGYVDTEGRVWIKDRAHARLEDHWDVQIDGGREYFRVDMAGELIP